MKVIFINKGSHDYLFIFSLDVLGLNLEQFIERCNQIKKNRGKYGPTNSTCGQKIYELLTGRDIVT